MTKSFYRARFIRLGTIEIETKDFDFKYQLETWLSHVWNIQDYVVEIIETKVITEEVTKIKKEVSIYEQGKHIDN